jgi:hypothetical protein
MKRAQTGPRLLTVPSRIMPFPQIGNVFHAVVEAGHLEVRARVAAGFFQLAQDVFHGDDTKGVVGKELRLQGF